MKNSELQILANKLRLIALEMISAANSGHPGGSLSAMDILVCLYFGGILKHNPKKPLDPRRDFFVLSKGHASAGLYAVLGERGFFSKKEFASFRQVNSNLQGHPTPHTPGVEVSGGSLGQGLSFSVGLALANPRQHVFTLLGDGELQEGQVWEAAMSASHFKLGNLTAIVDNNSLQIDGANSEVMTVNPIDEKFRSFGWHVVAIDGHNFTEILRELEKAKRAKNKPTAIIAQTVKGKGAPCAENNFAYHGVALSTDELAEARKNLSS
ncbi:transketolase [Candidatus Gracilibacteria bacterium]|nr:transketolase [Candidatus Gracilibacteria bacterium]MCF7856413.1 transketolase [Candidatus Gracilibacteria bacterium]MCF7896286.1 transketolase [Candidatus Gracilibacteria bacterium]